MEFALAFGTVGDFLALGLLIKDIVAALDDCRGSEKDYQDLIQGLEGLGKILHQVEQVYRDPQITNTLEDLCEIARCTLDQIKQCLEGFRNQIRKYETTLSAGASGSRFKGVVRKIQWKLEEKDVSKFRADVAGYAVSLKVLLEVTTIRVIQRNHAASTKQVCDAESRMGSLIRRSSQSVKGYLEILGRRIISKLDMVFSLGTDLQTSTRQIFTMMCAVSGDLTSIKAVVMRLDRGISDEHFVLEDVTGRHFPIHLKTITSWEAFEYVLNDRFKGKKGAHRIRRKMYFLQERASRQDVDRSMDWESAFLPYQRVDMGLMCRETQVLSSCPWCHTPSSSESGVEVQCATCNKRYTRVVEIEDEDERLPDAPSAPSPHRTSPIRFGEISLTVRTKRKRDSESSDNEEDDACSDCKRKRQKGQDGRKRKRSSDDAESGSDDEDVRGLARIRLISKRKRTTEPTLPFQAAFTESFHSVAQRFTALSGEIADRKGSLEAPAPQPRDTSLRDLGNDNSNDSDGSDNDKGEAEGDIELSPPSSPSTAPNGTSFTYESGSPIEYYVSDSDDESIVRNWSYNAAPRRPATRASHGYYRVGPDSSFSRRPTYKPKANSTAKDSSRSSRPATQHRKATEEDAKKHKIPAGYSLKNWDPDEEPVLLLGSVFDFNSLGKWIYDWAVYHHGPATPVSESAGELWLLLIQLAGKLKRSEHAVGKVRLVDERETVEDFIDSGDRLTTKLLTLLKACEGPMLKAAKAKGESLGKKAGVEFVEALFGRERNLERTEKFMGNVRLFNLRFDAYCEEIIRKAQDES